MIKTLTYQNTSAVKELLTRIEVYKDLFEKYPKNPKLEENLLRISTLKSSLFSARIEGNTLTMDQVSLTGREEKDKQKREVFQIYQAMKYAKRYSQKASEKFIKELHEITMNGMEANPGQFRHEPSAIFNQAGVAIYLSPSPDKIPQLIDRLVDYLNKPSQNPAGCAISHFAFEKIHPFLDGNGRVGRILTRWHLKKMGYGFSGLLPFETYLENNRDLYYRTLADEKKDITEFVEFFLTAIVQSAKETIINFQQEKKEPQEDLLLPRRQEILSIIRDHKIISFDQIRRRFGQVNPRTLHYDLEHLLKKNLIKKLGTTKGVVYSPQSEKLSTAFA